MFTYSFTLSGLLHSDLQIKASIWVSIWLSFSLNWKISSDIYFSANLLATDFLSFRLQKRYSFTSACVLFTKHGIRGRLFLPFSNLERLCHYLPYTGFLINPSIFFLIILTCIQYLFNHFLTFSSLTTIYHEWLFLYLSFLMLAQLLESIDWWGSWNKILPLHFKIFAHYHSLLF